jgi:hypothetical protein
MTHAAAASRIGRDFERFLFASIGEDRPGQALSVLSALARSNVDPWQEAVGLARMPRKAAAARLTRLIEELPREPAMDRPVEAIAGDLVALLPTGSTMSPPSAASIAVATASPDARLWMGLGAIAVLMTIGTLVANGLPPRAIRAAHREPIEQSSAAPVSSEVHPPH